MRRVIRLPLIVAVLLISAHRLPAPITENETPTPAPEQSATKPKRTIKPEVTSESSESRAKMASAQMGAWKLNEAKSKLTPGAGKNKTVVYQPASSQVKVTVEGTDAKGNPAHNEWIGRFDGQDYPVIGDPTTDTRAYTKVDDRTLTMIIKKGGRVTATGRIVVASDGMSRTVTTSGTTPQGKEWNSIAVYDKQ